ncbi:MAG: glycosyltransferase, partial [Bdellovibrionales bacterium]|nr:glycosyltransferase [Bdellovibrionales bacterium]
LVQPSTNESFCIVMMEGWLQSVPALVHDHCAVTREHVVTSNGGLYFRDARDFGGAVKYLLENSEIARELGSRGKRYVEEEYRWSAVLERFESALQDILREPSTCGHALRST